LGMNIASSGAGSAREWVEDGVEALYGKILGTDFEAFKTIPAEEQHF
jgi:hypothetical protein